MCCDPQELHPCAETPIAICCDPVPSLDLAPPSGLGLGPLSHFLWLCRQHGGTRLLVM